MDQYAAVRNLPFPALASALGIDLQRFKRRPQDWQGYCPIHSSQKNNGCFGYKDDGRWNCLSCGAHGTGAIDFCMALLKIGFKDAVERLAHVQPLPAQSPRTNDSGARQAPRSGELKYHKHFKTPCDWLLARRINQETADFYGCGWYVNQARKSAFGGRYMIPFRNFETGHIDGYMGRYIGEDSEQPKYLVPSNFPKSEYLFGGFELKEKTPVKVLFVVESPFAVLRFRQSGFDAVASYGWHVSPEQVALLGRITRGVVYVPDKNKATEGSSVAALLCQSVWCRFPTLPEDLEDPERLTDQQIRSLLL